MKFDFLTTVNLCIAVFNLVFTAFNIYCAVISVKNTQKQTQIMQKQLEEAQKPNYPVSQRLSSIRDELARINISIAQSKEK